MNFSSRVMATMALWLLMGPVFSNEIEELALEQKVCAANLIFTGEVLSLGSMMTPRGFSIGFAVVAVKNPIKGADAPEKVNVIYSGPISEFDPSCCTIGSSYLFFVEGPRDALYSSVNGRFGVYELQNDSVVGWIYGDRSKVIGLTTVETEILNAMKQD